jgi:hypothetical protein
MMNTFIYQTITMTLIEFEEHIAEYEARLALIAEQNWFKILLMHSVVEESTWSAITSWVQYWLKKTEAELLWQAQSQYISEEDF